MWLNWILCMEKSDYDFLTKFGKKFPDNFFDITEDDLRQLLKLVDKDIPEAVMVLNYILQTLEIAECKKYDGTNPEEFIDYLATIISTQKIIRDNFCGSMSNFIFTSKNICGILYHLICTSIQEYSLIDLFAFALCIDLKSYINDGDYSYPIIATKVGHLFKTGELMLDEDCYSLGKFFDPKKHSFIECALALCILGLALALKADFKKINENTIVMAIFQKAKEITTNIKKWFLNNDTYKDNEVWRGVTEKALQDLELVSGVLSRNNKVSFKELAIEDLSKYTFINYSKDTLGDGFTTDIILDFLHQYDKYIDHEKEHNDYLIYLDEKRPIMLDSIKLKIPNISPEVVKEMELSNDIDFVPLAGVCYLFGLSVKRNFEKAYSCFYFGSHLFHAKSAYSLSVMYLKSLFVAFDLDKWIHYLSLACRLGDSNAIDQWLELEKMFISVNGKLKIQKPLNLKESILNRKEFYC